MSNRKIPELKSPAIILRIDASRLFEPYYSGHTVHINYSASPAKLIAAYKSRGGKV